MKNAMVYAIADKYNLSALKRLASRRFSAAFGTIPSGSLTPVVTTVLKTTPSDQGLRNTVVQLCAECIDQLMEDSSFATLIEENAELTLIMFKKTCALAKEAHERLAAENAVMKTELLMRKEDLRQARTSMTGIIQEKNKAVDDARSARTSITGAIQEKNKTADEIRSARNEKAKAVKDIKEAAEKKNKGFYTKLESLLEGARKWGDCRHCNLDFDSFVELVSDEDDEELGLQLRCKSCRTRHDIGAGLL